MWTAARDRILEARRMRPAHIGGESYSEALRPRCGRASCRERERHEKRREGHPSSVLSTARCGTQGHRRGRYKCQYQKVVNPSSFVGIGWRGQEAKREGRGSDGSHREKPRRAFHMSSVCYFVHIDKVAVRGPSRGARGLISSSSFW